MFTYPQSLNPTTYGGANVAKSFDLVDLQDSRSVSSVSAEATTTPHTLTVSHQVVKSGLVQADRHLVRIDKTFTDPIQGLQTLSAYLVLQVPRSTTVVTLQEIKDCVGRLIAFEQAAGALDRLLNREP
jgi:uncharacterized protein with von Willebrand factor type A (vWA) domain